MFFYVFYSHIHVFYNYGFLHFSGLSEEVMDTSEEVMDGFR